MKVIPLDNSWTFLLEVRTFSPSGGQWSLDDGVSPTAFIAADPTSDTPINAALQKSLALRAATTGDYFATVPGADVRAYLASLVNQKVYEVYKIGTSYREVRELRVKAYREPGDE